MDFKEHVGCLREHPSVILHLTTTYFAATKQEMHFQHFIDSQLKRQKLTLQNISEVKHCRQTASSIRDDTDQFRRRYKDIFKCYLLRACSLDFAISQELSRTLALATLCHLRAGYPLYIRCSPVTWIGVIFFVLITLIIDTHFVNQRI